MVFVRMRPKLPVIARPVRTLVVAIPRLEGKCIDNCLTERGNTTIFGGNRYLVPFNRGIATPACALARNDSISLQTPICRANAFSGQAHFETPKGYRDCHLTENLQPERIVLYIGAFLCYTVFYMPFFNESRSQGEDHPWQDMKSAAAFL